jgi:autotransporter-associated beta strand protein
MQWVGCHRRAWGLVAAAVGLLLAAPAQAIVLFPDDTTPAAVLPSNDVVGRWSTNASCVVVDPNYILTTRHQNGGVGSTIVIGTASYTVAQEIDNGSVDMRLLRITNLDGTPANLATYTQVYTGTNEASASMTFAMGGYGKGRGTTLLNSSGAAYGYNWDSSGNTTLRWGANVVDGTSTSTGTYNSNILVAYFNSPDDPSHVAHEAAVAQYDSGGGWFVDVSADGSGDWRLIGLMEGAQHVNDLQSWFDPADYFFAVRVGSYASWVNTTLGRSLWNTNHGGNWSTGAWTNGAPNGQDKYAILGDVLTGNSTLTLDTSVTLGTLWIDSTRNYTLNRTGTSGLIFDSTIGPALLNVSGATAAHTISAPVTVNSPLTIMQRSAGALTFSGGLNGAANITKTGAGTLVLSAPGSFGGTLSVAQGLLRLTSSGALGAGGVTLSGGSLNVRSTGGWTLTNALSATADATLTVDGTGGATGLTFAFGQLSLNGDHTFTTTSTSGCAVAVTGQATLTGATTGAIVKTASADLRLTGGLTFSTGSLTKIGSGAMTLSGPQAYGAGGVPATLNASAGTVNFDSDAGPAGSRYGLNVNAAGAGAVNFRATQHLAGLTLTDSATASVATNGATVVVTNALSIGSAAKLDLKDNDLVVNYAGATPLKIIEGWIKAGAGSRDFQGVLQYNGSSGITSSAAAGNHLATALGLRDCAFNLGLGSLPALTDLEGVPVDPSAVVVKYTYYGDLNLDGKVNVDDYNIFAHYITHDPGPTYTTWMTGDLNYDGRIDVNDYNLFTYGYSHQDVVLSTDEQILDLNFAPEPATLAFLALGAAALLRRRAA